jgi:hypothetical protein
MEKLKEGDKITIAGYERGLRGQLVINGVNPQTNRKCRTTGLMQMVARAPIVPRKGSGG